MQRLCMRLLDHGVSDLDCGHQSNLFDWDPPMQNFSRRAFTFGAPLALAGCAGGNISMGVGDARSIYGQLSGERFPVPAIDLSQIDPQFYRQDVAYASNEAPGTIVVDPGNHFLYHVKGGGRATRYGVGVGKEGFGWSGVATINSKQEWPDWYPPPEMIERDPSIKARVGKLQSGIGVPGGPHNPLGARAMYLWQGNKDTLFRIHGTLEPWTIGKNVSSGCIRMVNQDAIDLYSRVAVGTVVKVI